MNKKNFISTRLKIPEQHMKLKLENYKSNTCNHELLFEEFAVEGEICTEKRSALIDSIIDTLQASHIMK